VGQTSAGQLVYKPLAKIRHLPALRLVLWAAWVVILLLLAIRAGDCARIDPFSMISGFPYEMGETVIMYPILTAILHISVIPGRHALCAYFYLFSHPS
jgi:hypothetical protein